MEKLEVEIFGLSSSPSAGGAYALILREVYGSRRLPIIIGAFEAQSIALALEGVTPQRPLTHDLLKSTLDQLGASLIEVIIDELKENTFYAKIVVEVATLRAEIDARPSDAIALAVRTDAPIFVREDVMRLASYTAQEEDAEAIKDESEFDLPPPTKKKPEPSTKEEKLAALQNSLRDAIEKEDYERAARIRDEIKNLSAQN